MKKSIKTYCFITMEYPQETGFGGIGTYVWHMARALHKKGIRVTILSYSTHKEQKYIEDGIVVVRKILYKPIILWWYFLVTTFLMKNKFDIVEDTDFLGSAFFYQTFFKNQLDFFHVKLHTPHVIVNYYENKVSFFQKIKTAVMNYIESSNARKANIISSPSRSLKQIIEILWNISGEKIYFIPNAFQIESTQFKSPLVKGRYMLYFGRIQKRKSADLLLSLIQKDFLKKEKIKFILIGKDAYSFRDKLLQIDNFSSRNTFLIDFTHNKNELYNYISHADRVFLPSKFDNSPLTNLESLWYNPNTFVLNNSGPFETMNLLGLGENALAEEDMLKDPSIIFRQRVQVSQHEIRSRIEKNFNYDIAADRVIALYENN